MNILDSIEIDGFWIDKKIDVQFFEDVNFLIGANGSGKTTAINLVAAALTADFETLDRLTFSKIEITLKQVKGRRKPQVVVTKKSRGNSPFPAIEYKIRDTTSENPSVYSLDELEEQLLFRDYQASTLRLNSIRKRQRTYTHTILEHLQSLVKVSWLSVHRAHNFGEPDRNIFVSTVDKKLDELSNRLVRYFSALGKRGASLLERFQETIFLSLLISRGNKAFLMCLKAILKASAKL